MLAHLFYFVFHVLRRRRIRHRRRPDCIVFCSLSVRFVQEQEVLARGTTFVMNENFLPGSASGNGTSTKIMRVSCCQLFLQLPRLPRKHRVGFLTDDVQIKQNN